MLTLYEHSTSVCVIKVRLTLAEKGLAYDGKYVDIHKGEQFDPAYRALNPGAVVPTLVHDGAVNRESSVIQCYLDDAFPDPPLMPDAPADRARVRLLMKTIDDPIHPATGVLTHGIAFRKAHFRRTPAEREARFAAIPDPGRRERQRSVYEHGLDSPFVIGAVRNFDALLADMETGLAARDWLGGPRYSLADAAATPYVNRLAMLGLLDAWREARPNVMAWYERMRARPSFDAAITRWFTERDADMFAPYDPGAPEKVGRILAAMSA